jgi:hypothetical protein
LWLRLASGVLVIVINRAGSTRVLHPTNGALEDAVSSACLFSVANMILNQISYLDCVAFLIFLAPQLLVQIGLFPLLKWLIPALPFISKSVYNISLAY